MNRTLQIIVAATLLLTLNHLSSVAFAQGTTFTYQGQLQNNGSPVSGTYNLTFTLFATDTGGTAVAGPVTISAVAVTNGLFTVTINFGSSAWNSQINWLEIGVETNNASSFTTLAPRQQVTPTPYAIYAENANGLSGTVSASQLTSIGNYNFFVGPSGNSTMSGFANSANGVSALGANTSGSFNTADGLSALGNNTIGSYNTANGADALGNNTSGSDNTANGDYALLYNTTGSYNTADGFQALDFNTSGLEDTAIGMSALYHNISGYYNTASGVNALFANTDGSYNTADGMGALGDNTSGSFNTANGVNALYYNTSGTGNTANGYQALVANTNGYNNTANGVDALFYSTSGNDNTADGFNALGQVGSNGAGGTNNIALGYYAGFAFTGNESSNIDIGNIGVAGESGVIRIGTPGVQTATYLAGSVGIGTTSAARLLQIGSISDPADGMIRLGCGNGAQARLWDIGVPYGNTDISGTNYSFIIRDASVGALRLMIDFKTGDVCIGTNTPLGLLTVGTAYCNGTSWQNGSDRNSKEDFSPVSSGEVLAKVAALPITQWQYKMDAPGIEHLGPMAQDFHAAFGLNGTDDKHISTVDEGGVALAAIQGLNQKLETDNTQLKQENTLLTKRLDELEAEVKELARNNR